MKSLKALLPYIKPYKSRLLLAMFGTACFTIISSVSPLFLRFLIDSVIRPRAWQLLPYIGTLIIVAPFLGAGIRFVSIRLLVMTSRRFISDMRKEVYGRILKLSMRYHGDHESGVLVGRLMGDINMLQRLISGNTVMMIIDFVILSFSLIAALIISPMLWVGFIFMLTLYCIAYRHYSRRIRTATQSFRDANDLVLGRLQETVAGVRQVRIYNREDDETELFLDRTSDSLQKSLESNMSSVGLSVSCQAIAGYGSALISAFGAIMVLKGQMTYGDLLAFNIYLWMAISPTIRLTTLIGQLEETFVSVRRVLEVLHAERDIVSAPGSRPMHKGTGAIEFRDIHFSYDAESPLYEGLSLDVEAGSTVALVGPTGCGKTTLVSLLMRFWDVHEGAVLINGTDVRDVTLSSVRNLFGFVPQNPVLFEATLAENIAYGKPGASREEIEDAARTAEIYETAMRLPDGFDSDLGTKGVRLSVGEKQRINIARAVLKNPEILVMDEATSSLDSESEFLIQRALTKVRENRTSFIIAHRLSTVLGADMIVVMDGGRIVEKGTHEELMRIDQGLYRGLCQAMRNGAPEEAE